MTIKAIFLITAVGEETTGQVRAACQVKQLTGVGTGVSFNQDFNFDPTLPNVHTQIAAAIKDYLINHYSISFGTGDVVMMLPNLL